MTWRDALTRATSQLAARPELRESALEDAALLLLHVLGTSRATLMAYPERAFSREQQIAYQVLLQRRITLEPIQYILGTQEFFGLSLRVTPATLIPRPETELLVEAVLERLAPIPAPRILDVGTGTGALALALARHLPQALVTALELSPAALEIATENAHSLGLAHRVIFLESDLLHALPPHATFDAIVSNPPYVPDGDAQTLHSQVRDFEPALALFAGPDGLAVYRRLIPQAHAALAPGALLALEIGHGQRAPIEALLASHPEDWSAIEFHKDLRAIDRIVLATRTPHPDNAMP